VTIIVNGQSLYKPGMKTFFADDDGTTSIRGSEGKVVGGTICTCEAVCTCESYSICTCESYSTCTCDSQLQL
jgi:hypothetical protein